MKIDKVLVFILLIPALVALGHDIYLFYEYYGIETVQRDIEQQIEDKGPLTFFASLGFIWTRYAPDSYKWVVENMDQPTWEWINLFLTFKAFFVGIAFAVIMIGLIALLNMMGLGEESSRGFGGRKTKKGDDLSSIARGQKMTFKYKKK